MAMPTMTMREVIVELRGGESEMPTHCDACKRKVAPDELEPEEGGLWVCSECWSKWNPEA